MIKRNLSTRRRDRKHIIEPLEQRRLLSGGLLDKSFGTNGETEIVPATAATTVDLVVMSDKTIFSLSDDAVDTTKFVETHFLANGTLDSSFGTSGQATVAFPAGVDGYLDDTSWLLSSGKILIYVESSANSSNGWMVRLNTNGTVDTGFGTSGALALTNALGGAVQSNGSIIVNFTDGSVKRYTASGALDGTFASSNAGVYIDWSNMAVTSTDKIVTAGNTTAAVVSVSRFLANGGLDTSFNGTGTATFNYATIDSSATWATVDAVFIQSDNKVVVMASFTITTGQTNIKAIRFNANGTLDTSYGTNGIVTSNVNEFGDARGVMSADDKIVVAGSTGTSPHMGYFVERYNTSGVLDTTFGTSGSTTTDLGATSTSLDYMVIQPADGKILLVGSSDIGVNSNMTLLRYVGTPHTFVGVYRSSTAMFYLKNSLTPGPADIAIPYGAPGDTPVVGDWNGDGITTFGIYRPSNSTFYLRNTNTAGYADLVINYGLSSVDTPIVGDWDGDGTTTVGVYRSGTATFYLRNSNTAGFADLVINYGSISDNPVAGDWNGDGITTIGIYRPNNSTFYLKNTNTNGYADLVINYGVSNYDTPIAGDWNGDGITTVGVYRSSTATFYLKNTNTPGVADLVLNYGSSSDSPVAGTWT